MTVTNPLADALLKKFDSEISISIGELAKFIFDEMEKDDNFFNFDSEGRSIRSSPFSVFYSGITGESVYNGNIAVDLSNQTGARVIDKTPMGTFVASLRSDQNLISRIAADADDIKNLVNQNFSAASENYGRLTKGKAITILSGNAEFDRDFVRREVPNLLNPDVTEINGVPADDIRKAAASLDGDARLAYLFGEFQNSYSRALQDSGLRIWWEEPAPGGMVDACFRQLGRRDARKAWI
jgi:hypothetical protein